MKSMSVSNLQVQTIQSLTALTEPHVIIGRGKELAVLVPYEQWINIRDVIALATSQEDIELSAWKCRNHAEKVKSDLKM